MEEEQYVTLRRINVLETGEIFEKFSEFPSGFETVDYQDLLAKKFITTLEDFTSYDKTICHSCGID